MDVFEFRTKLVADYAAFTRSFTRIHAEDIQQFVDNAYNSGHYGRRPLSRSTPIFSRASRLTAWSVKGCFTTNVPEFSGRGSQPPALACR